MYVCMFALCMYVRYKLLKYVTKQEVFVMNALYGVDGVRSVHVLFDSLKVPAKYCRTLTTK